LQDRNGYVWVTTDNGLCRFGGDGLKVYTIKDGISENVVFNIHEDAHGRVWFSTLSGYFFYYFDGKFTEIKANPELKAAFGSFPSSTFFVGENDTLYCASPRISGLIKVAPENNYSKITYQIAPFKQGNRFGFSNKLNQQQCVFGSGHTDNEDSSFVFYFNSKLVNVSLRGNKVVISNCWKGCTDKKGNIYVMSGNTIARVSPNGESVTKVFPQAVVGVNVDSDGDLWIGVKKIGGFLYKNADFNSVPIRFLTSYSVSDVMLDREGSVWVCTLEKGIFLSQNKHLLQFDLDHDQVIGFQKEKDKLIIGYSSGKVAIYDSGTSSFSFVHSTFPSNYYFNDFLFFEDERYYSCTEGLIYKKGNGAYTNLNPMIVFRKILQYKKDTLIGVTFKDALLVKGRNYQFLKAPGNLSTLTKLSDNKIIAGSRTKDGLFFFDGVQFVPFLDNISELRTRINCVKEDNDHNLWVGTNEKGLFCISGQKLVAVLSESSGLISDKVNSIEIDKANNIWVGTSKGLSKISKKPGRYPSVVNFGMAHGLPSLEIEQVAIFNNVLWCATKDILFYFSADKMRVNTVNPFTKIDNVQVNNLSIDLSTAKEFRYDQNNIDFTFYGVTYKDINNKEFIYKLEGYDSTWRYSKTGSVQYTNLAPASYNFKVYALNNDKLKSLMPATFSFVINKPFWKLWWMIVLEILAGVLLIFVILKLWVARIKRVEEEKTFFNQQIASFHMTAIRAQMNPHFVFNAISSIQHYILQNDTYRSYDYLAKFSMLIRKVLDNSQEEYISLSEEISTLKLYIELEQIRFDQPFRTQIDIKTKTDSDSIFIPTMLLQPYIENAIRHGLMPKKTDGLLFLKVEEVDDKLFVTIRDNGVGRTNGTSTNGKNHNSKAITLNAQRLQALQIKHARGYKVEIIDLKNEEGESIGTEVRLTISFIKE
jgi:sugar lactone lactonase YvrE